MQLDAVVLAAGTGSRFNGGKLLAAWRGGRLIDGALAAAFDSPAQRVTVVWGADDRVPEAARAFADRIGAGDRLRLVNAQSYADGLSASLKAGIKDLKGDSSGAFIFLGDMPRVPKGTTWALADALSPGALAAAPIYQGRRGHPVLFASALYPSLLALSGDQGAASVLAELGQALVLVEAKGEGVLFDVDHPQDLNQA